MLFDGGERGTISVRREAVVEMARDGTLLHSKGGISLSAKGSAASKRMTGGADRFQDQHRDLEVRCVDPGLQPQLAVVNLAESPLGQLMRRRTKDGQAFLSEAEFAAGERLRADYTRGRIMPRLGANWEASVSSGGHGRGGGLTDLTDASIASRQRVDAAIAAVGPELAGVLIDVCCFLKGLELVESERGWPVRSAKIVLKTALGVLGRHYNPGRVVRRAGQPYLHWGSADYRPSLR